MEILHWPDEIKKRADQPVKLKVAA